MKTLHTRIDMTGDIPDEIISVIKKVYGDKATVSENSEYVDKKIPNGLKKWKRL